MGSATLKRGDVVVVARGKPRPAVIVQADGFVTPELVLVCPFTSFLTLAPAYRLDIAPTSTNGLQAPSQLMVDQIAPARRDRIDRIIGRLTDDDMVALGAALALVLDLGFGA